MPDKPTIDDICVNVLKVGIVIVFLSLGLSGLAVVAINTIAYGMEKLS